MTRGDAVASFDVRALESPMRQAFEIASGAETSVRNVLVEVRLACGARGFGEGAPLAAYNDDTQQATLGALRGLRPFIVGRDASRWRPLLSELDARLGPSRGAARAAVSMALLDAWTRRRRMPLRLLFGGAQTSVASDVTVTILPADEARLAARRIAAMGIRTIKIKVGRDVEDDADRVRAVACAARGLRLILDANQGYGAAQACALLRRLRREGIRPALFEQPVPKDDWEGLAKVARDGAVAVAADESVSSREDALRMARKRCAQVVNIKLMKCGVLEAWDIAAIARSAGLGLMMGGNIESSLAMTCAAHFAAGLGGFSFIDLDTPLWFSRDPMRGVRMGRGGVYDLSRVASGIGVTPK